MIEPEEKPKIAQQAEAPVETRVVSLQEMFEEETSLPQGYRLTDQEADIILKSAIQRASQEPPQEP